MFCSRNNEIKEQTGSGIAYLSLFCSLCLYLFWRLHSHTFHCQLWCFKPKYHVNISIASLKKYVTYFAVSSRYSPILVAKSTICSTMSLQLSKCFLYLLWARSAAILSQSSSSFLISSARSNLACWAKACTKPQPERWNEWRRHGIKVDHCCKSLRNMKVVTLDNNLLFAISRLLILKDQEKRKDLLPCYLLYWFRLF